MPIIKTDAYILRLTPYSNTSMAFSALSSNGALVRALARGIRRCPRKGFEGSLDLLSRGEIVYYPRAHGGLALLKEWAEDEHQGEVGGREGGLEALSCLAEMAENLAAEEQPCPGLFEALEEAVRGLRGGGPAGGIILRFLFKGLAAFGEGPEIWRCVRCGRRQPEEPSVASGTAPRPLGRGERPGIGAAAWRRPVRFSAGEGGIICGICAAAEAPAHGSDRGFDIGRGTLEALRGLLSDSPSGGLVLWRPLRPHAQQLARLLTAVARHAFGAELRTLAAARGAVVADGIEPDAC
ncbi:MAG: DNA repair protein RecO C-terminal domain-containing protein [Planctomycetota bacterium]|nr:DNA repair protein RecO C-terminal domain-containing protein [Planctomycetota bacterium]